MKSNCLHVLLDQTFRSGKLHWNRNASYENGCFCTKVCRNSNQSKSKVLDWSWKTTCRIHLMKIKIERWLLTPRLTTEGSDTCFETCRFGIIILYDELMFASVLMYQYPKLCCYFAEREIDERARKTKAIYVIELKRKLS